MKSSISFEENLQPQQNKVEKVPRNIGGWLILLAIGIVFSPFRMLYFAFIVYFPMLYDNGWKAHTLETSNAYLPSWGLFLFGEIIINLAILLVSIYLVLLFFGKKSNFPKWYASISLFSVIFLLIDSYILTLIVPTTLMFDVETIKELSKSLISLFIWTPYLFLSQRSKETFVN